MGEGARLSKTPWQDRLEYAGNLLQQLPFRSSMTCVTSCSTGHRGGRDGAGHVSAGSGQGRGDHAGGHTHVGGAARGRTRSLAERARLHAILVSLQEEMDWRVYGLFGLPTIEAPLSMRYGFPSNRTIARLKCGWPATWRPTSRRLSGFASTSAQPRKMSAGHWPTCTASVCASWTIRAWQAASLARDARDQRGAGRLPMTPRPSPMRCAPGCSTASKPRSATKPRPSFARRVSSPWNSVAIRRCRRARAAHRASGL